jgi:G protein-coupled receptor kinase interacting protein 2
VKTNNYELCLRILSQGADANYRNPEDSLTCLHNAVLHSQLGQIELLCIYGADLMTIDRHGNTPIELSRVNNLNNIADRLIELQFELTDDLTYFVSNKRPDHKSGQHFLIPDLSEK